MITVGSGAKRELINFELSRYARYLITQNGDPDKLENCTSTTVVTQQQMT